MNRRIGNNTTELTAVTAHPQVSVENTHDIELGSWFWVKDDRRNKNWLGCVTRIGSNFLLIEEPSTRDTGSRYTRVHFDDVGKELTHEPDAENIIRERIAHFRGEATRLIAEVKAICSELGLRGLLLADETNDTGTAIAVLSEQVDVAAYKNKLVLTKDTTLPKLFDDIKSANQELTRWMTASTLPLQASIEPLKGTLKEIEGRIFNVSLYAGLTEQFVQCADGQPAALDDKLHILQRRLYMDEECLVNYQAGGMEFKNIHAFDEWIAQPINRDRILPFPCAIVSMRVRRDPKERGDWNPLDGFIQISLENADKATFLYIRNGEKLYRLCCDMDFGEMIFPDPALFSPTEPKVVKMFAGRIDKMMGQGEYDYLCEQYKLIEVKAKQWDRDHPKKERWRNPFRTMHTDELRVDGMYFRPKDWDPVDPTNVYFDECMENIDGRIREYNRIALVIQGLFDRSDVLHPHPPAKLNSPAGFDRVAKLVYDSTGALHHGDAPDFEAYRAQCNASLSVDSVVTGQQDFWLLAEGSRETRRLDGDWRNKSNWRPKRFKPYGNPGPGNVAKPTKWQPRAQSATFAWARERTRAASWRSTGDGVRCTITVPARELLNISAYRPGDYKRFYADPRTRSQYLQWAPLMLVAEDYHAGKIKLTTTKNANDRSCSNF